MAQPRTVEHLHVELGEHEAGVHTGFAQISLGGGIHLSRKRRKRSTGVTSPSHPSQSFGGPNGFGRVRIRPSRATPHRGRGLWSHYTSSDLRFNDPDCTEAHSTRG